MFRGKRAEFEALVHSYSAELYRYAYYLSRDRVTAEDLVQETFARAWSSWTCYREPLLLQVVCGFTCDEIAKIMNLTPGATMTRLSRARLALRKASGGPGGKEMSA